MNAPVAIIGMSGVFPLAPDLDAFHRNLLEGVDAVRTIPTERLWFSTLPDVEYPPAACLDRIDLFDPRAFGLSLREAELMDPHQRMTMQLVCKAI
ncbi:MAG TPA: beta-ketoacyl synthase N-terminal-like domain-containing protein, partial [Actinomycetota bacterium]|nr:beta-ketoacyl synthase N-terminal-like domain-containing protein [Actinomycetota bacterium]